MKSNAFTQPKHIIKGAIDREGRLIYIDKQGVERYYLNGLPTAYYGKGSDNAS